MNHAEMTDLLGFLKGAFPNIKDEQVELYSAMLMSEDAELASKAILAGVNEWKFPPTWADIRERIVALRRGRIVPVASPVVDIGDYLIPQWVRRWAYARYYREEPDMRAFRESYPDNWARGDEPVEGWMPAEEYDEESKQVTNAMIWAAVSDAAKPTLKELLGGP